jgi:hypothetical protein
MILMASSHIYMFCFIKLVHVPHTHTYIYILYWPYAKIRCISNFRAVSEVSGTAEVVLTGHVQLMDQTYPASQTCPAPGPDIFGSRVLAYIYKGDEDPFES